jgi:F420H(2)-dependent quinone reductase
VAGPLERIFRSVPSGRVRNRLARLRGPTTALTRLHAALIRKSGGRIRRSHLFTGGMLVLVLTTTGRKSGKPRSTPLGYLRDGNSYAVLAANAGSERAPLWWLNLQAEPRAQVEAEGRRVMVTGRRASDEEDARLWAEFAAANPAFGDYRNLTGRKIPVVILEPDR